ncbi:MAG TPA: transcriptional repressor [Xanthomonadaceae bacterium]|jgi:Fur family zinc uptake transcriptional regulator
MNEELLLRVEAVCRERGLRLTPLRSLVLGLIARAERPLKAYEVLELISAPGTVAAPPTVYRTIDFLLEHGFVHKLESINAFAACRDPRAVHTGAFLICDRCRSADELLDEAFGDLVRRCAGRHGFAPHAQTRTLEVHGLCTSCAELPDAHPKRRRHRGRRT